MINPKVLITLKKGGLMKKIALCALLFAFLFLLIPQAEAKSPYSAKYTNMSRITLTGEITDVQHEKFMLDYGDGVITVEMDDWDSYDEADYFSPGERVTVFGVIDNDWYHKKTIEADSVYAYQRDTFYDANPIDEEDTTIWRVSYANTYKPTIMDGTWLTVIGKVKSINGNEFMLDTGIRNLQVDTDPLGYNPFDDIGIQKIIPGDVVKVSGKLDKDLFERNEIQAQQLTTIHSKNR